MRTFIVLASLSLLGLPLPAQADFVPVLPGSIDRVVAAGEHVAVLRGGTVFILREDGTLLGRIAKPDNEKPTDAPPAKQEVEHMLDLLDVAEIDRDTDYTEDLLDDERRLAQRRRKRLGTSPAPVDSEPPPALAASASDIWIAAARGIFHVGADGIPVRVSAREGWGPPLAAGGQQLLATNGNNLALLTTPTGPRRLIQLPGPSHKAALSASGRRQAWATSSGIVWTMDASKPQRFDPTTSVVDLTYCGETLVILLADSVLVVPPDGQPEMRSDHIQAHHLICPEASAMPWLAVGKTLWASVNQGRLWEAMVAPAGVALVDVAVSTHHVWLASRDGLYTSTDGHTPTATLASRRANARRASASWVSSWLSWMPKISVRAAVAVAPGKHQVEALAFAAFPLNSRSSLLLATALPENAESEPESASAPQHRAERTVDLHDPDESCLPLARRKAVELAMSEPERARSYVTRAGHAAWLPELRVLVSRRYGRSESLDVNASSTALTSPLGIDTVNDIRYEARATWDLGKLVFSSEELAAQTQAIHMAELRRDIETTMNRLYFERRGLVLDLSASRGEHLRRQLRASEIEAELDAMSAGTFAACVSGSSLRVSSDGLRPAELSAGDGKDPPRVLSSMRTSSDGALMGK